MSLKCNIFVAATALTLSAPTIAQTKTPPATQPATPPPSTAPGQTQTTPGQLQTTPGEASQMTPADTGQTPSEQTTGQATTTTTAATQAATAEDVKKGVLVYDQNGASVGKVESVSGKNAVVSTGTSRASIPVSSFAKNDKGLVIAMSKADIDAATKKSAPKKTK